MAEWYCVDCKQLYTSPEAFTAHPCEQKKSGRTDEGDDPLPPAEYFDTYDLTGDLTIANVGDTVKLGHPTSGERVETRIADGRDEHVFAAGYALGSMEKLDDWIRRIEGVLMQVDHIENEDGGGLTGLRNAHAAMNGALNWLRNELIQATKLAATPPQPEALKRPKIEVDLREFESAEDEDPEWVCGECGEATCDDSLLRIGRGIARAESQSERLNLLRQFESRVRADEMTAPSQVVSEGAEGEFRPYRIERREEQKTEVWWTVIHPDGTEDGTSWREEVDAEEHAEALVHAYEAGRTAVTQTPSGDRELRLAAAIQEIIERIDERGAPAEETALVEIEIVSMLREALAATRSDSEGEHDV